MSYAALRISLLAARDQRQALLERLFPASFPTTLMLSLNLPGDAKTGERAEQLFVWGEQELTGALPMHRVLQGSDALGPFALYHSSLPAREAKLIAMEVEGGHPAGRLLDLDIYDASGQQLGRSGLGFPPRSCLLCEEAALACIRAGRHTSKALKAQAHMVIDAL
jgi:holo-ACP synthase